MNGEITVTLPTNVSSALHTFIAAAKKAFGDNLLSVVLYGSGAEGKLRPTSDVNVILLLGSFDREQVDHLREPLRVAQAAIKLRAMFLLQRELKPATQAFAVKFADIARRHVVLYGENPFAQVEVSRQDAIFRLKQTLLNLTLRLRETYVARTLREEQIGATIADAAGPLRACASTLLELERTPVSSSKEALEKLAATLPNGAGRAEVLQLISEARQRQNLQPGVGAPALFHLIDLAYAMWVRAAELE